MKEKGSAMEYNVYTVCPESWKDSRRVLIFGGAKFEDVSDIINDSWILASHDGGDGNLWTDVYDGDCAYYKEPTHFALPPKIPNVEKNS